MVTVTTALAAVLLAVLTAAPSYGFPHGGAACQNDMDCCLGGVCTNNACVCDPWFTGDNCTYLNLAHAEPTNGLQVPGYHTWGGHSEKLPGSNDEYVGFFSLMENHCSLSAWTTNSACVMATAEKPEGPYTLVSEADELPTMVTQPWCHNTYLSYDPTTKEHKIFHIGDGVTPREKWKNCTYGKLENSKGPYRSVGNGDGIYVAKSLQLNGPYTNDPTPLSFDLSHTWATGISNPAPYIFDNGTTYMYYSAKPCPDGWGLAPACIGMAKADNPSGPFVGLGSEPLIHPESEDPDVFRDPRGNFHMLTNVNTYHKRCKQGVACGGHAWSKDGLTWTGAFVGAFGPVITLSNGTVWQNAYVERPQVVLDSDGVPMTFFVGMGRTTYMDSISWAQPFCKEGQTNCGPTI